MFSLRNSTFEKPLALNLILAPLLTRPTDTPTLKLLIHLTRKKITCLKRVQMWIIDEFTHTTTLFSPLKKGKKIK